MLITIIILPINTNRRCIICCRQMQLPCNRNREVSWHSDLVRVAQAHRVVNRGIVRWMWMLRQHRTTLPAIHRKFANTRNDSIPKYFALLSGVSICWLERKMDWCCSIDLDKERWDEFLGKFWTFSLNFPSFKVYQLISRRRFQQMEVLEGQNILVTISGKKNRVRVYYLSWLKSKILRTDGLSDVRFWLSLPNFVKN